MYKYEHYLDFPLQENYNRQNPLTSYIPENQQRLFQMPRQISSSPFMPSYNHKSKLPTQSNHSISKFAFTQTSTQDQKEEDQIIPVCQNLLFNQKQIVFNDQGIGQEVTQATFKPNQLQKQLQAIKNSTNHLKKLLADNLLKKQHKNTKAKSLTTDKCISKTKTKYQKILEQFYCKKENKETVKRKVNAQKVQNYKLKFREDENVTQRNRISVLFNQDCLQSTNRNEKLPNKNKKQSQITTNVQQKGKLRKTFSVQELFQQTNRLNRQISVKTILQRRKEFEDEADKQQLDKKVNINVGNWLGLTFHQRQQKSLEKRREKENIGKQLNLKKEVQNCTFKPIKTQFKLKKHQNTTASSYAKRYYQKLKRL